MDSSQVEISHQIESVIRNEIAQDSNFDIRAIKHEINSEDDKLDDDEVLLRVFVWLQRTDSCSKEYLNKPNSPEFERYKELKKELPERIRSQVSLEKSVGVGTVVSQDSHLQVIYPRELYETRGYK